MTREEQKARANERLAEYWSKKDAKPTNADRIRAMTDEELAEFITQTNFCDLLCDDDPICKDGRCDKHLLDWLKQEATVKEV